MSQQVDISISTALQHLAERWAEEEEEIRKEASYTDYDAGYKAALGEVRAQVLELFTIPDDAKSELRARARVLADLLTERDRQDAKWGPQDHSPHEWLGILMEEVGEAAQAANEAHWRGTPLEQYRKELVESGAVIVAAIQNLDWRQAA